MYQVNLLPWRAWRQRRRYLFWLRLTLAHLGILLLILLGWRVGLYQQQQQWQLAWQQQTEQQLALEQQEQQLQGLQTELAALQQQDQQRRRQQQWNQFYLQLLRVLPELLPPPLWLTRLEANKQHLKLTGKSHESAAVLQLERRLAQQPKFIAVELQQLERGSDGLFYFTLFAQPLLQAG